MASFRDSVRRESPLQEVIERASQVFCHIATDWRKPRRTVCFFGRKEVNERKFQSSECCILSCAKRSIKRLRSISLICALIMSVNVRAVF